jgi:hypothetical protein
MPDSDYSSDVLDRPQLLGLLEIGIRETMKEVDSVRVQVRPQSDTAAAERQLSRSDGDLQLNTIQGSLSTSQSIPSDITVI